MRESLLKNSFNFALVGILLMGFVGYLVGALIGHPIGPAGLPVVGALIGVLVALAILFLGEALKTRE